MLIPLTIFVLLAGAQWPLWARLTMSGHYAAQPQVRELLVAKKADSEQPAL